MNDILSSVEKWCDEKVPISIATVIKTWGSSPRAVGAKMIINSRGEIAGSVSGGCVEGAVAEAAKGVLDTGNPVLLKFGVSDEGAWEVGLACGGEIEVFVQPLNMLHYSYKKDLWVNGIDFVNILVVGGPNEKLGKEEIIVEQDGCLGKNIAHSGESRLHRFVMKSLKCGVPIREIIRSDDLFDAKAPSENSLLDDLDVFIDPVKPAPTLIIVGGVHIAIELVTFAKALGFYVIIVDPRRRFGNSERFPHADQIINTWPKEALTKIPVTASSAVAVLTHDPKIDDVALGIELKTQAFYVGALGSRNTQLQRRNRLIDNGITTTQLERLHGPIGLEINSRSPEEIALSIMAEIILVKNKLVVPHLPFNGLEDC